MRIIPNINHNNYKYNINFNGYQSNLSNEFLNEYFKQLGYRQPSYVKQDLNALKMALINRIQMVEDCYSDDKDVKVILAHNLKKKFKIRFANNIDKKHLIKVKIIPEKRFKIPENIKSECTGTIKFPLITDGVDLLAKTILEFNKVKNTLKLNQLI